MTHPVDAKNLTARIKEIKAYSNDSILVAIDASLGGEEDLPGMVKLKEGPLRPGKALAQKLPPIGDIAVTGIVGKELNRESINSGSISDVYFMARELSRVIGLWQQLIND